MKLKTNGPSKPVEIPKQLQTPELPGAVTQITTEVLVDPGKTQFRDAKPQAKSNTLEPPRGRHTSIPVTGVGFETSDQPLGPLASLRASGKLGAEMQLELRQKIVGEGSVDTRDQSRTVPMIRSHADLKTIDQEMSQKLGPAWSQLKDVADKWASRLDDVANAARLPPEGIHPDYALAGRPLLKAAQGVKVSPADLKRADTELAALIGSSNKAAAATAEVWLRQFGVGPKQAPQAFQALQSKLGALPAEVKQLIADAKTGKASDAALAGALSKLAPQDLLRAQHELSLSGLVSDRLTFYGANATPQFASKYPLATAALLGRDVRQELLAPFLDKDPQYQSLKADRERQLAATGMPRQELEWALLQDQKLRFLETENKEGIADPAGGSLASRDIEKTFFDHLRARREGDLEKDLRLNYDPDIVFTSNQGNFFGHDGVRNSAANLAKLVPGREWVMNRLSFSPGKSPTEGYATEVWSAELEGRLVTAVDNFFIKDGKIVMQSAYYTEVRRDLERNPV